MRARSDNRRSLNVLVAALFLGSVACGGSVSSTPAHTPSPSAHPTLTAAEQAQLAQLEARPLKLPQLRADGECPVGPFSNVVPYRDGIELKLFGAGPVYAQGGHKTRTSQYAIHDVTVFTDPTVKGVVLIRGQQIGGPFKVVFPGDYGAGPLVGTGTVGGEQVELHSELALPADRPPSNALAAQGWGIWKVQWGIDISVDKSTAPCTGFQIDTASSTEVNAG